MQHPNFKESKRKDDEFLPQIMFHLNKIYMDRDNKKRIFKKSPKSDSQKHESTPHRIDFNATTVYKKN